MDFSTVSSTSQTLHSQRPLAATIPSFDPWIPARSPLESFGQSDGQLSRASSIVFVDSKVEDYQNLIAGVQPGTEVYVLNPAQDAVAQITQALLGRSGISSLHIVSHGEAGELQVGNTWLSSANLRSYTNDFQAWASAFTPDADILLYGCNVAQGEVGRTFVQQLAQLTGADIAASQDWTGSAQLGGNWELEVNTGEIAASLVFQASAIANYHHILPVDLISAADPNAYGDSPGGSAGGPGEMSSNGRYVVFTSTGANLVANDTNRVSDVFVRDLQTGTTHLVSANWMGTGAGNGTSDTPNLSKDGRYVVFASSANDLVANDTNNARDVFVRDLLTGTTTLVSANLAGTGSGNQDSGIEYQYLRISDDNRYVVFTSRASNLVTNDTNNVQDVFMRDLLTSTTRLISVDMTGSASANQVSSNPSLSGDGRYIVFISAASNLVAGDTNSSIDVFVRDILTGTTTLASANYTATGSGNRDSGYSDYPRISQDGRYVTFTSDASDLVTNDLNNQRDIFRRDLVTGTTELVSSNYTGTSSGNLGSFGPTAMSRDGRYVAFRSDASDLALNDANSAMDVFVRDMVTRVTTLVSVNRSGTGSGNGASASSSNFVRISGDGRYVTFASEASDLVANDTNSQQDIFVRDLSTGTTTLASRTSNGSSGNQKSSDQIMSMDGQTIAFLSTADNLVPNDGNTAADVFAYRLASGTVSLVSQRDPNVLSVSADEGSGPSSISADGRYVVFTSDASNLVLNDRNGLQDIFLRDRVTGSTTLVSRPITGGSSYRSVSTPIISSDGRYVVFTSDANNLVANDNNNAQDIFLWDRITGTTTLVSRTSTGSSANNTSGSPALSSDGRYVVFVSYASDLVANDNNRNLDVFLYDHVTGSITLVSRTSTGSSGNGFSDKPIISSDGRYVVFTSYASNLIPNDNNNALDIFLWDRITSRTTLVNRASSGISSSSRPSVSADGRYVVYTSTASDIVVNDNNRSQDVFLWDRVTGTTTLVSRTSTGSSGNSGSSDPIISGDGRYVVYTSTASNLVPNDDNNNQDIFVWDRATGSTTLVSRTSTGSSGSSSSSNPAISEDGNFVTFISSASNLDVNDNNGYTDVFVWNRQSNSIRLISRSINGSSGSFPSYPPIMSSDGSYVVFSSGANNLVAGDVNGKNDVFGVEIYSAKISISSVNQTEGRDAVTAYTFTVNLSKASDRPITIQYTTADGTATTADNDYVAANGTLTFNPGETSKTITINVKGDRKFESDETFQLKLSNPANAEIVVNAGTATGTIINDDKPISISINSVSQAEGQNAVTAYTFTINLSEASDRPITVQYTTADGTATTADNDYVAASGTLTFNPGETSKTITINVKGDRKLESDETFQLKLSNPANAEIALNASTAIGTIINDDKRIGSDFNSDGKVDILWRNSQTGQLGVWLLNGTQYDRALSLPIISDLNWKTEATADFDGDGDLDLLWRHAMTGQTGLWILNGTRFERSTALLDVPDLNWQIAGTADFNRDGTVDIVWRNRQTGDNAIWLMNQARYSSSALLTRVADLNWQIEQVADLDGDGDGDLLWRNSETGQAGVWLMNQTSVDRTFTLGSVPDRNWQIVGTADLDGDGNLDIVWRNHQTGENALWLLNGTSNYTPMYLPSAVGEDWKISNLSDYDGDGDADLLWRNEQTGQTAIWTMNGVRFDAALLFSTADPNWVIL